MKTLLEQHAADLGRMAWIALKLTLLLIFAAQGVPFFYQGF